MSSMRLSLLICQSTATGCWYSRTMNNKQAAAHIQNGTLSCTSALLPLVLPAIRLILSDELLFGVAWAIESKSPWLCSCKRKLSDSSCHNTMVASTHLLVCELNGCSTDALVNTGSGSALTWRLFHLRLGDFRNMASTVYHKSIRAINVCHSAPSAGSGICQSDQTGQCGLKSSCKSVWEYLELRRSSSDCCL